MNQQSYGNVSQLKQQAHLRSLREEVRSVQSEKESYQDIKRETFTRLIRDGMAEEVRNALLEAKREIEHHKHMGRLSSESLDMVNKFQSLSKSFLQRKLMLEKIEGTIEEYRKSQPDPANDSEKVQQLTDKASQLRDQSLQLTERLLKLHQRLDKQIQKDRQTEERVQEALHRCLQHLPKTERGKLQASTSQKLNQLDIEGRIQLRVTLIQKLAQSIPAVRKEEVARLYDEASRASSRHDYQTALQTLDQLFQFDKHHLDGHRLRASLYEAVGNAYAHLFELRMITEMPTAQGSDFYRLARVLRDRGQDEEAFAAFQSAAEKSPLPEYLEAWGDASSAMKRWYIAVQAYRQLLNQQPSLMRIQHKLGVALFENNQAEEAFDILRTAIHESDARSDSRVCLARAYRSYQMFEEALQSLNRAVELDESNPEARYWLSLLLYERGEFEQGLIEAKEAIKIEKGRLRNCLQIARCYDALGQTRAAIEELDRWMKKAKSPSFDVLLQYAKFCRRANLHDKGIQVMQPMVQRFPYQPQLRIEYGLLLLEKGQLDEAAPYLDPAGVLARI